MFTRKLLHIKQVRSVIGAKPNHKACVRGLGLRKNGQEVIVEDTPSVRGMIKRAAHLIEIQSELCEEGMNIEQYIESGRTIYTKFASCVADILKAAISNANMGSGVQQIQHRAKEIDSLSRKLKDRGYYHSDNIEREIKDLAGCRIIFYHNDDINTFLQSHIVSENFDVDWDESKVHHPNFDAQSANDLYMGHHFVVTIKPERAKLPEFAKFAGLRCEIQAQTLLNHAWSETIHDITYKSRHSKGFGDRAMSKINDRLMGIMKDYLRPASYEFQKVKHDFKELEEGRDLFNEDINQAIEKVDDTNALYELLERYKDYVLPNYTDYSSFVDEIYLVVETSLQRAKSLGVTPIETLFGSFDGKEYREILSISLDILGIVRYLNFDKTLAILGEISKSHTEPAEQDIICDCAVHTAAYNEDVLRRHGYVVQENLIDALISKSDEELLQINKYAIASCQAILTPSIEKTEWTHTQVKFGKINLPGSIALGEIRSKALELLGRLVKKGDHSTRQSAFACMEKATQTPHSGDYDDKLLHIVLANTNVLIQTYIEDMNRLDFDMMQTNEERVLFYYRRAKQIIEEDEKCTEVLEAANTTVDMANKFREKARNTPNYERYKVLIGFRSIFEKEWNEEQWGWREKEDFRNEQIGIFVESIKDDTLGKWVDFLEICARADSSTQYLSRFLVSLAEKKPEIAKRVLQCGHSSLDKCCSQQ